jgi:hypothetical protein
VAVTAYTALLTNMAGDVLGKLPTRGLSYERRLGGSGSCSFRTPVRNKYISGSNRDNLGSWRSEIDLYRNGIPVHSGPVLGPSAAQKPAEVTITSATATRWLYERLILRDLTYLIKEQTSIYSALVAYAQSTTYKGAYANNRLVGATRPTGVTRQRRYLGVEQKNVGQALEELTLVENGFDITLSLSVVGGRVIRTLLPSYPYAGQAIAQPLQLGVGGLTGLTYTENTNIATYVAANGAGEGSTQVKAKSPAAGRSALEATYGVHETSISLTDIKDTTTLQSHADESLRVRKPPITIIGASYIVCDATPFRCVTLGDTVPIVADLGWMTFSSTRRVVAEKVTVADSGRELIELTFNDPLET